MEICFLGGGNMASALIGGMIEHGTPPANIAVIEIDEQARNRLENDFRVRCLSQPDFSVRLCSVIILAIKPQQMAEGLLKLAPFLAEQTIVSIAAGVRLTDISQSLDGYNLLLRAMPNLPALIGSGVIGLYALPEVGQQECDRVESILRTVGKIVWLTDESRIDMITALSGCGPAYLFYFIEALLEAARQLGCRDEDARKLVIETVLGSARLAAISTESISDLRARVTSPGGATAAALEIMNELHVNQHIVDAVLAAESRSRELGTQAQLKPIDYFGSQTFIS